MTARRAARAAAAQQAEPPVFDYRDPQYGIPRWPPAPDNPVPLSLIRQARRRAREARKAWEHEHGQHNSPAQQTAPEPTPHLRRRNATDGPTTAQGGDDEPT